MIPPSHGWFVALAPHHVQGALRHLPHVVSESFLQREVLRHALCFGSNVAFCYQQRVVGPA